MVQIIRYTIKIFFQNGLRNADVINERPLIVARKISLGKMLPGKLSPAKGEPKNLGLIVSVTIVDKGGGGVCGSIGDDE